MFKKTLKSAASNAASARKSLPRFLNMVGASAGVALKSASWTVPLAYARIASLDAKLKHS